MKLSANFITSCPVCKSTMIIANPTKQEKLSEQHKIEQRCGECKRVVIIWIEISVKSWEVKQ